MRGAIVPYVDLALQHQKLKPELLQAMERVLNHGQFILGPEVNEFEEHFAKYCGSEFAIGVDNGTSAMILVLRALGIGPGDEVITAPNSFLASTSCIALVGARPVFVDACDDYNIDPTRIQDVVTPRTKAILPIHLTGRPADLEPILEIASQNDLYIIEDCAQAIGAQYHRQHVGTFGIAGCFSLHPLKTLNALGDGGVILTSNVELYRKLQKARNHGLRNRNESEFWSFNGRLDTLQASVLMVKMEYLDHWIESRRANAAYYQERLEEFIAVPEDKPYEYAVYHTFVVQTPERDALKHHLLELGIETSIHYPIPVHLQEAARDLGYEDGDFPKAERQARQILSLPVFPELTDEQRELVVHGIESFFENRS